MFSQEISLFTPTKKTNFKNMSYCQYVSSKRCKAGNITFWPSTTCLNCVYY